MPRVARDSCLPTSHVFITSKHPDLAPCPPSSQSHHHPPGRGLVGWAGVGFPVYTIPTPGINSCWFCFYFNFFCFDFFKIRIFILSTFILKEFVLCIGGSWIQSWGCGSWGRGVAHRGSCSPAHSSRPPALPLLFSSLFSLKL